MAGEEMHGAFDEKSSAVEDVLPSRFPHPIMRPDGTCFAVTFSPDTDATSSPPAVLNDDEMAKTAFTWGMAESVAAAQSGMWLDEGLDRRVDFSLCREGSSSSNIVDDGDYEDVGNKRRRKVSSSFPARRSCTPAARARKAKEDALIAICKSTKRMR